MLFPYDLILELAINMYDFNKGEGLIDLKSNILDNKT